MVGGNGRAETEIFGISKDMQRVAGELYTPLAVCLPQTETILEGKNLGPGC